MFMKRCSQLKIKRPILDQNTQKPPVLRNKYQLIIWQLLDNPSLLSKTDWGREIKAAKTAWNFYPNLNFWKQLYLGFYLRSLNYLASKEGKKDLFNKINQFRTVQAMKSLHTPDHTFDETKKLAPSTPFSGSINYKDYFKNG